MVGRHSGFDRFAHRQCASAQPIAQRLALEQFRDDIPLALVRADVVNREHVGMRRGHRLRFALESRASFRIDGK